MKNDPTASATMDYELMKQRAESAEARAAQAEAERDEARRQLAEARDLIDISLSFILNRFDEFDFDAWRESYGHEHAVRGLIKDLRTWLAANHAPDDTH